MELKNYQKQVITDLSDYLSHLLQENSLSSAFAKFWESRQIAVGTNGFSKYQNTIAGVPNVCFKVPTGGGKTLLGCASIKPIIDALPPVKHKALVWLVPSESILTQTLAALKNSAHPYRKKLNVDFGGRVEVYSKQELLAGQNFSPATVVENLTVMVLSYDSFRTKDKEDRKAYQENGALAPFVTALGAPEYPIEGADDSSLFQIINQLNPVVVVDESHHATTSLSQDMLKDFNPSFILDLTATPKKQANVISYVDALALKSENMVKLPVIVYNRASKNDVITDAMDLRNSLEVAAKQQQAAGGQYIRPIVLFQAQPKTGENATSFERLREKLVAAGIDENEIAIKTAEINELKGVDLMSPRCPTRFIITVNALKEGWDCAFAYVLASLANKTSQIDVEQILGRVLRLPNATKQSNELLNMSYVLTSSSNFALTLDGIIAGLNKAGFSKRDFRAVEQEQLNFGLRTPVVPEELPAPPPELDSVESAADDEDFLDFDPSQVTKNLNARDESQTPESSDTSADISALLNQARTQGAEYEQKAKEATQSGEEFLPADVEKSVSSYAMYGHLRDEANELKIPQFVVKEPASALFPRSDTGYDLLQDDALAKDFTLRTKDIGLDLSRVDEQMYSVDVSETQDTPRAMRMSPAAQEAMRKHFAKMTLEQQQRTAATDIYEKLKPVNAIGDTDLRQYISRVVDAFTQEQMLSYLDRPQAVAAIVKAKIDALLTEHKARKFYQDIETGHIDVQPHYSLPSVIHPPNAETTLAGSLYEGEGEMNNDERELASRFSALGNIRWWHRNPDTKKAKGFCLNGPLNHFPDFMLLTDSGKVILVEPKGAHLRNYEDTQRKLRLGLKWAELAGRDCRYYMVFQDGVEPLAGSHTVSDFLKILETL